MAIGFVPATQYKGPLPKANFVSDVIELTLTPADPVVGSQTTATAKLTVNAKKGLRKPRLSITAPDATVSAALSISHTALLTPIVSGNTVTFQGTQLPRDPNPLEVTVVFTPSATGEHLIELDLSVEEFKLTAKTYRMLMLVEYVP